MSSINYINGSGVPSIVIQNALAEITKNYQSMMLTFSRGVQIGTVNSTSDLPPAISSNVGLTMMVAGNPTSQWRVTAIGNNLYRWVQIL